MNIDKKAENREILKHHWAKKNLRERRLHVEIIKKFIYIIRIYIISTT